MSSDDPLLEFLRDFYESTGFYGFIDEPRYLVMVIVGLILIYLAIAKEFEPLLLLPIGFGCILVNIPLAGMMNDGSNGESVGPLYHLYEAGILTELFPILIFIGIGAMTDFTPLLKRPKVLILGATAQFGIFFTLIMALQLQSAGLIDGGLEVAASIAIIGAADGPSAIFLTTKFAPEKLGPITVCAYSYMAMVPLIQPPLIKILTSEKERLTRMPYDIGPDPSQTAKIMFPISVTIITCSIAPMATPLMGSLMLGNIFRESGVVDRLAKSSEQELTNIVTILLGITIGATMQAKQFLTIETLVIFVLGLVAFATATATGVFFGKAAYLGSRGSINPMIGACGISAFPMSARVIHKMGLDEDPHNFLIGHTMAVNTGGQIGSVVATGMLLLLIPLFL
ncbi:MAG: sodium ion-translocating decarboxylase subunit beta [Candidatus Heimdallarchaeota archaeon]